MDARQADYPRYAFLCSPLVCISNSTAKVLTISPEDEFKTQSLPGTTQDETIRSDASNLPVLQPASVRFLHASQVSRDVPTVNYKTLRAEDFVWIHHFHFLDRWFSTMQKLITPISCHHCYQDRIKHCHSVLDDVKNKYSHELKYTAVIVKLLKMPFNVRKACSEIKTKMNCKHVIVNYWKQNTQELYSHHTNSAY